MTAIVLARKIVPRLFAGEKKCYQCFLGFYRENITSRCFISECVWEPSGYKMVLSALGSDLVGIYDVDPTMDISATNSTSPLLHIFVFSACNK